MKTTHKYPIFGHIWLILSFVVLLFISESKAQQTPNFTVFLIGDTGEPQKSPNDFVLNSLQTHLSKSGKNSSVVFMGDNIYPKGLVNEDETGRKEAEDRLIQQLNLLKNYEGKPFIIPGNHDWQQGGKNGWNYVKNQEKFVENYLQNPNVFYPKGGCPTPHEVNLTNDISLLLLDTQWWLHPWQKPDEKSDCEVKTLEEMLTVVNDMLDRNQHKNVIVVGHHPMYSHGSHGGYFTPKDHLFPLNELGVNIPLPFIGSIYPFYRGLIGNIQDIAHPQYRQMRDGLVGIFKQYPNVMYANGHEHNLQLIVRDSINYITSGAGSKQTPVKMGKDSEFAQSVKGFARVDYYDDKTVLSFWEGNGNGGKELYQKVLPKHLSKVQTLNTLHHQTVDGIIPNPNYGASAFKKWLLGTNYRDVWTTPIQAKTINFSIQEGGLKVTQRGGGFQTLSLRYQNKSGLQFVTRSVEKYPALAIPASIRSGFTEAIVSDQISASHPFAALAVAQLAEKAGVLHTNPQLVIIPNDTILHNYKRLFSNQLALFEERPDGGFAGSKKILSTTKLVEKLAEDNHNKVDEQAVLKARIFDMWIGDWDRHDDQWRWAGYENGKGMTYKPIPRDRDQAFFVNQGILPKIVSRKWIMPKIQGFDYTIRDVPGLAFNARYFDRSFLTQSTENEWIEAAKSLQKNMTHAVIDSAVNHLPNFANHSTIIAAKLKRRRTDLVSYAQQQYQFLNKAVDILGSIKDENIEIKRLSNGETDVSVFDQTKDGLSGRLIYHRVFEPHITKEIRIWGLDGDDKFMVKGVASKGIKVRLIGGKGKDSFIDSSSVSGWQKKTIIYDKIDNSNLSISNETKSLLSNHKQINDYQRESFNYDVVAPLASFEFNPDQGLFLGSGIQWTHQGFRKSPFASRYSISGNYSFGTSSYNLYYKSEFTDLIGKTDFELNGTIQQGGLVDNFFGYGNESDYVKEKGIDFYRTQYENQSFNAIFKNQLGKLTLFYGLLYDNWEIKKNPTRFINEFASSKTDFYDEKAYLGIKTGFVLDYRNNPIITTRGLLWNTEIIYQKGIDFTPKSTFFNLKTDISLYYTFKLPAIISLATRFGGGINFEDYEIYQANTLGGLTNLRGFRRSRFAGKSSFYNNTEVRMKVLNIKSYLFPAFAGVLAFHDVGRVWNPQEKSDKWHRGYGAGLWFSPFNMFVFSGSYGISEEDKIVTIRAGMFF
jgi:hypothetical protein